MKTKNTIIRTLALTAITVLCQLRGEAQFDAMFTQYMFNETFINPAYAGSKEAMSATLLHRQQWVNFPGRPITTSFAMHGPLLDNKMGLGLNVLSEKVGAMNRNLVYGTYAYRLKVHEEGTVAFGLMGGLDNQIHRYANLKVSDDPDAPIDPNFLQNTPNVMAANFGMGVYYNTRTYYAGLSVPRLLDNDVKFNYNGTKTVKVTSLKASRFTYYLTLGNVFTLNESLKLRGTAMVKAVKNAPVQLDLSAVTLINDMIWAGLSYRSNSSLALILGFQVNKQFLVNYSYDYGLNRIQRYSQGSHEFALNYLFSFKGRQIITPRYF
jgi:type IX secretion system PorP/SprF family membrane protein